MENQAINSTLEQVWFVAQEIADAISSVLVQTYGISKDRILTDGLGEADPVASNDTEEGRAQNRRIEASTL